MASSRNEYLLFHRFEDARHVLERREQPTMMSERRSYPMMSRSK